MKRALIFVLTLTLSLPAIGQVNHHSNRQPMHKKAVTSKSQKRSSTIVDTVAKPAAPVRVAITPPADTARKDTTGVGKVAQVVHDSVKAQIKAPIVQIPVTLKSLIIPGALFAYGALTLNTGGLRTINEKAHNAIWDGKPHGRPYIEDYLLLVPAAAVYGLNIAGVKGQNNLVDRSIIYGMSNAIANGIVFGVKYLGVETRPDSSDHFSFPSGHTAEAFVSAEFFRLEYRGRLPWPIIASGYAVATGIGYLRMYHNKHWLSDVVAGAGVGIASTRFSYYLYPIIKHVLFGSRKVKENTMILPTYQSGAIGFALVHSF